MTAPTVFAFLVIDKTFSDIKGALRSFWEEIQT